MSIFTRNRFLLFACAVLAAAQAVFAADPGDRTQMRMVFDARTSRTMLFGGATPIDAATLIAYDLADTWEWVGDHWVQRFPAHTPTGRSLYSMVYDTTRFRTVMFGGKSGKTHLNDTWTYDGNDWTEITPTTSPAARILAGAAYDSARDRIVLFGGNVFASDGKTLNAVYDTWEFDGTNWIQVATAGPTVIKPILVYDPSRGEMLMLGMDPSERTLMYSYDAASATWKPIVPPTLPDCVNESGVAFQSTDNTVILFGGACTTSSVGGATWQWDGESWSQMTTTNDPGRLSGEAMTFDAARQQIMMYGGSLAFANPRAATIALKDGIWNELHDPVSPSSRSLFIMATDPDSNTVWMFGGQNETDVITDFWEYQNGKWTQSGLNLTNGPSICSTPTAAYDTDRKRLIVVCADSGTFEWDGTAETWTAANPKTKPGQRRFSSMSYDPVLKKTVLLGGFDDVNFLNATWLWDGTNWSQQKNKPPTARYLAAQWFDPLMKKTVVYGGIGRASSLDRLQRYSDMWSFDGNGWTQMKAITATPGQRYGAQTAIDPTTNTLLLFGGIRLDVNGQVSIQVYANDMWKWDGNSQTWTQLQPQTLPAGRENGKMAFDPTQNAIVLFGGFNGLFLSDLWTYDLSKSNWTPHIENVGTPDIPTLPRRRPGGG
jgi:Galactose oxidase, central domain